VNETNLLPLTPSPRASGTVAGLPSRTQLRRALSRLPGWRVVAQGRALRYTLRVSTAPERRLLELQAQRALEACLAAQLSCRLALETDQLKLEIWSPGAVRVSLDSLDAARTILRVRDFQGATHEP
jgi:hypothetical protein